MILCIYAALGTMHSGVAMHRHTVWLTAAVAATISVSCLGWLSHLITSGKTQHVRNTNDLTAITSALSVLKVEVEGTGVEQQVSRQQHTPTSPVSTLTIMCFQTITCWILLSEKGSSGPFPQDICPFPQHISNQLYCYYVGAMYLCRQLTGCWKVHSRIATVLCPGCGKVCDMHVYMDLCLTQCHSKRPMGRNGMQPHG